LNVDYIDDISALFNGTTTSFTLQTGGINLPGSTVASDLVLFVGGAIQQPGAGFTWNSGTSVVTFTAAPATGLYFVGWVAQAVPSGPTGSPGPTGPPGTITQGSVGTTVGGRYLSDGSILIPAGSVVSGWTGVPFATFGGGPVSPTGVTFGGTWYTHADSTGAGALEESGCSAQRIA
jgi:hypothetical protein